MDLERLQQIETLYNDALEVSPGERPAFLARACGNDLSLRRELESLLACQPRADTYLDTPAFDEVARSLARQGAGGLVDRRLGRYQLLSLVGRGGMAEVYCAVDTRLNRLVAVKILPEYMSNDPNLLHQFEQEARAVAALNHRHICTVHDMGNEDGMHYLVFEYVAGEALSDRLYRSALPLTDALDFAVQIAEALVDTHEHGITHLDLKPENIMLSTTGVKLVDFGIAEQRYAEGSRPKSGTAGYMPPEQADGREVDSRSDIFAFGAVMYQMFTGRSAFPGGDCTAVPPPVSESRDGLPVVLDSLVGRCLAPQPSERWQSISDVLSKLQEVRRML